MREIVSTCLAMLRAGYKADNDPLQPQYDERLWALSRAVQEDSIADYLYLKHIDGCKAKPVTELTRREVITYLTYIFRGERFNPGHIASYIGNGKLQALLEQYLRCTEAR